MESSGSQPAVTPPASAQQAVEKERRPARPEQGAAMTKTTLKIGPGLTLPIEAVTETFAILAKRGSGKTYTAKVMVEEMADAGLPVVVVDPVGVWWGLRSAADGKSDGLPFVIFGGDHADVPLEATAGELLADLVVDERIPAVLDLSSLTKSASRRFMTDFLERLYHRNRDPLHVVLDEADAFAPQRTSADGARLLGAVEDLVRRGRARGLGVTLITQRPAVLNKDVLTQAEVLVALRMTGPRDVAAIDDWVRLHADEDQAAAVKASLPSLPIGTAWWWSPGWLGLLERVQVRQARTFDSSATPKPGHARLSPRRLTEIDLGALGDRIAATVERAKADDPKALRRRLADVENQLAAAQVQVRVERVEVPVLAEDLVLRMEGVLGDLKKHGQQAVDVAQDMLDQLHKVRSAISARPPSAQPPAARQQATATATPARRPAPAASTGDDAVRIGKTEKRILAVLAQHGPRTHRQLALQTGYSARASTIGVSLGKLRKAGLVEPGQPITATAAGIEALGDDYEPLPTGPNLLAFWQGELGKTENAILSALIDAYPDELRQADIAERTGYSPTASTIGVALGRLRRLELVEGWRVSGDFARSIQ